MVAADGTAAHRHVQDAVDAAVAAGRPAVIRLQPGIYRGVVRIPKQAPPIALVGSAARHTVIVHDNFASKLDPASGKPFGTFGSSTVFVHADDFSARGVSFANDAGQVGQAVALTITGTRAAFREVRVLGHQDTLYLQGRDTLAWFADCDVHGTVDFIFGAGTGLFERCRIHSLANGYVTAAATPQARVHGLVFNDCELTAAAGVNAVYLGRPWREHAQVAFVGSALGAHILAAGWHDWGKPERQATARFVETGNRGAGAATGQRVAWSRQFDGTHAASFSRKAILGDWNPQP